MSRIITASLVHDGNVFLPQGSSIELSEDGHIIAICSDDRNATHFEGIIAPGFVNAHCHLELSHLKGVVPEHTGLIPFLKQVIFKRNDFSEEQKAAARAAAYEYMWQNGIAAIGDIANTADTITERAKGKIHFHTFVEALGFTETQAQQRFGYSRGIYDAYAAQTADGVYLNQSIVPHAPYSVSPAMFRLIDQSLPQSLISIHNQETPPEDQYYKDKTGAVNELHAALGIDSSFFTPSGKSSLQTYLPLFQPSHPFLFIHNSFTTKEDIAFAQSYLERCYWCLCPNANLYIENALPDVELLARESANICLGTDSLSSNHQLSIMAEIVTLQKHFPALSQETLLQWATANGAKALQMENITGRLKPGYQPGIIQITGWEAGSQPVIKRMY